MHTESTSFRKTRQRDIILKVLKATKTHPTAEWIYNEVRKELPKISLGTVYRNLRHLILTGRVVEYTCQGDTGRFDANVERHFHITCLKCRKMFDIDLGCIPAKDIENLKMMTNVLEERTEFRIIGQCMGFVGLCRDCQD